MKLSIRAKDEASANEFQVAKRRQRSEFEVVPQNETPAHELEVAQSLKVFERPRPLNGHVSFDALQVLNCRKAADRIVDIATDDQVTYQIVGDIEADINENRIAISSPIARALIGKHEGEEVIVEAPGGTMEYAITSIQYV